MHESRTRLVLHSTVTIRTAHKLTPTQTWRQSTDSPGHRLCAYVQRLLIAFLLLLISCNEVLAADAIPGEQWCNRTVDSIRFVGNKVTQYEVMNRELLQKAGESCSLDDVIDGIQNNLDLGLFKSVRAELHLDEDHLELVYFVDEKIYFLPIPRFSRTSDGELRFGAQLRWDNFLGRLHQLKLTYEKRQEDNGQGRTGYVHSLDYVVPRFFGSRFGLGVSIKRIRNNTELAQDGQVYGEALQERQRAEFRVARWANESEGVQGLSYFVGAGIERRDYELRSGTTGPFNDGLNVTLLTGFEVQRVHRSAFSRRGFQYGVTLRVADTALGGDFSYAQLDAFSRLYIPLQRPQTNLNVQFRLGLSSMAPFGQRDYGIGGGELIRGLRTGSVTGDILMVANAEYLSGFFAYPAWRWVAFADVGNVYLKDDVNLLKQVGRGGVGLRWKLEQLTSTDLRIDIAWDSKRSKLTPYVSTSLTF